MKAGIYKITFPNGKFYIGSSQNAKERLRAHKKLLENGKHVNRFLQNCFNKYKKFDGAIILICKKQDLIFYEQLLIDNYNPELNFCKIAGTLKWTNSLRERVSEKLKKIKRTEKARAEQSERTKKLWEDENYRKNQSERMAERMKDEKEKRKVSDLSLKRWKDPIEREKILLKMREAGKRRRGIV